jgi:glucose/arabinose dehydrogenase
MRRRTIVAAIVLCAGVLSLYACGERATLPVEAGMGPHPELPPPNPGPLPTVNVAPATFWPAGKTPVAAPGLSVTALAQGLDHPRWLYTLPNGDILVAETNSPDYGVESRGIKGFVAKLLMNRAGAGGKSPNRITLLREAQGGGLAQKFPFITSGLNSPFGMALVGSDLYVADTDAVLRFAYQPGQTRVTGPGQKLVDLPGGPIDHHWTKNVVAGADGTKLYVSVGSNSNVAENGMAAEDGRAAVWEVDRASGAHRVFASGLRNPVGMAWQPVTHALWVSVNERDEIGSDLVPDYMTAVHDGAFYGWPYSYYGQHVDTRAPARPDLVATAIAPDYALGPHTASLGLCFSRPGALPAGFTQGAFVGQHGSWNRKPRSGYKVIFVPFGADGRPDGKPVDVLTGFLDHDQNAQGRPVGVTLDASGALLVADDVGNTVWRVISVAP